jgi:DNA (cytosine-5)-methyltransferase 1
MPASSEERVFINLFAGGGGLLLGLERAGFRCAGAVEIDPMAGKTLANHLAARRQRPLLALGPQAGDVRSVDFARWKVLLEEAGVERLDLVAGGPPCQSFSRVGRGKLNALSERGFLGDERNRLWREFFRAVETLRPRAFLVENVPGMLHHGGVNVADVICRAGQSIGYRTAGAILNAAAFGVPQVRERLFILGIDATLDAEPSFPIGDRMVKLGSSHIGRQRTLGDLFSHPEFFCGTLLPESGDSATSVSEALDDLPCLLAHLAPGYRARLPVPAVSYRPARPTAYATLMRNWPGLPTSEAATDHVCKATPRDYDTFGKMKHGDRYPDAVAIAEARFRRALSRWRALGGKGLRPKRRTFVPPYRTDNFPEKWRKLIPTEPSWTVTAHLAKDTYSHIHHDSTQRRMISIREAARLQSFPDAYAFFGNMGHRLRQIGNAVPPLMAAAIGQQIARVLEEAKTTTFSAEARRAASWRT